MSDTRTPPELDYLLFDPAPYRFPRPALPMLPMLDRGTWRCRHPRQGSTPAWQPAGRLHSRARYALHDALALSGVGPNGSVLMPAYHCRTMLDPAIDLGAQVLLFPLHDDLTADMAAMEGLLRAATVPVRAVLMPHYFGFAQDLRPLAALCGAYGAKLIEDCAHALPSAQGGPLSMGHTGEWCIASPYKFFACADGGALWRGDGSALPPAPPLRRAPLRAQVALALQRLARSNRPTRLAAPELADFSRDLSPAERQAQTVRTRGSRPSAAYTPSDQLLACSWASEWVIRRTDMDHVIRRRREIYALWSEALRHVDGISLFRARLAPDDTPYAFPAVLDNPERHFHRLKRAGLPIYRWDSLAASECSTSARLRLRLIQLPCHQSLTAEEVRWMIQTVQTVLQCHQAEHPTRQPDAWPEPA